MASLKCPAISSTHIPERRHDLRRHRHPASANGVGQPATPGPQSPTPQAAPTKDTRHFAKKPAKAALRTIRTTTPTNRAEPAPHEGDRRRTAYEKNGPGGKTGWSAHPRPRAERQDMLAKLWRDAEKPPRDSTPPRHGGRSTRCT